MPSSPILQAWRKTLSPSWGEVFVQTQPRKAPTQQARERRLARLQRLGPQVFWAVQLEEVEGIREHAFIGAPVRMRSNTAKPRPSQATASPSMTQDRALSPDAASRIDGKRPVQSFPFRVKNS